MISPWCQQIKMLLALYLASPQIFCTTSSKFAFLCFALMARLSAVASGSIVRRGRWLLQESFAAKRLDAGAERIVLEKRYVGLGASDAFWDLQPGVGAWIRAFVSISIGIGIDLGSGIRLFRVPDQKNGGVFWHGDLLDWTDANCLLSMALVVTRTSGG